MKNIPDVFSYLRESHFKNQDRERKRLNEIEEVETFSNKEDQDYQKLQPKGIGTGAENETAPKDTPDVTAPPEELPAEEDTTITSQDVLKEFDKLGDAFESLTKLGTIFSGVLNVLMNYRKELVTDNTINNIEVLNLVVDITERMVYMNSAVLALEKELGEFYTQKEEILKVFGITPEKGEEEELEVPETNPEQPKPEGTAVEGEVRTESVERRDLEIDSHPTEEQYRNYLFDHAKFKVGDRVKLLAYINGRRLAYFDLKTVTITGVDVDDDAQMLTYDYVDKDGNEDWGYEDDFEAIRVKKNESRVRVDEKGKKWSSDVETKWDAPEGFFTKSATKIARGLKASHKSLKSAMSSLNFYINRQGSNLSGEDKIRLENAKDKLRALYSESKTESVESKKAFDTSYSKSGSIQRQKTSATTASVGKKSLVEDKTIHSAQIEEFDFSVIIQCGSEEEANDLVVKWNASYKDLRLPHIESFSSARVFTYGNGFYAGERRFVRIEGHSTYFPDEDTSSKDLIRDMIEEAFEELFGSDWEYAWDWEHPEEEEMDESCKRRVSMSLLESAKGGADIVNERGYPLTSVDDVKDAIPYLYDYAKEQHLTVGTVMYIDPNDSTPRITVKWDGSKWIDAYQKQPQELEEAGSNSPVYIRIASKQEHEAKEAKQMLKDKGVLATIRFLQTWEFPEDSETTYTKIPHHPTDRIYYKDNYVLVDSLAGDYIALYKEKPVGGIKERNYRLLFKKRREQAKFCPHCGEPKNRCECEKTLDESTFDDSGIESLRGARVVDNGAFYSVIIPSTVVSRWATRWPGSDLPHRPIHFQFDKRNGDLVDIFPDNLDGDELLALSYDAQEYGKRKLGISESLKKAQGSSINESSVIEEPIGEREEEELSPEWEEWVRKNRGRFNNHTGRWDFGGDIDLYKKRLNHLPLSFGHVGGYFYCGGNQLTSLEGAPQSVNGVFSCGDNHLTSLEGAPQSVDESFYCNNNQLTSLEGTPQKVGGSFECHSNQLTSLEGAPQSVSGDFSCFDNQLTSLEGAPQSVSGSFHCYDNELTSLEGAPQSVDGGFSCSHNHLTSLEGAPQSVGGSFYCYDNQLTSLEGAPQSVDGNFYCYDNPRLPQEEIQRYRDSGAVQGNIYDEDEDSDEDENDDDDEDYDEDDDYDDDEDYDEDDDYKESRKQSSQNRLNESRQEYELQSFPTKHPEYDEGFVLQGYLVNKITPDTPTALVFGIMRAVNSKYSVIKGEWNGQYLINIKNVTEKQWADEKEALALAYGLTIEARRIKHTEERVMLEVPGNSVLNESPVIEEPIGEREEEELSPEWERWVRRNHGRFNYETGRWDFDSDINLSRMRLNHLPLSFGHVDRAFTCSRNQLTSLEGAPQSVNGDFYCFDNQLTSLEGAPQSVGGDFDCGYNQLTSLEGAPQNVDGDFYCYENQLTSLEGAPQSVDGGFSCSHNHLTSLEGAPQHVGENFCCVNNPQLPHEEIQRYRDSGAVQGIIMESRKRSSQNRLNEWKYRTNISINEIIDDMNDEILDEYEGLNKIVGTLKDLRNIYPDGLDELETIIDTFETLDPSQDSFEDDFDVALEDLYDWADDFNVYIGI